MTGLDPALIRIDRARLLRAGPQDAPRLTRALDQLTPAGIGLNPRATLIVRRLALGVPLPRSGPADGFVAGLRDDLRARLVTARARPAGGGGDLFFEDDAALEAAIVHEWLDSGTQVSSRSWLHCVGASAPLTRWRKQIMPDATLLARVIVRLVIAGIAEPWLIRFDAAEICSARAQLLACYGAAVVRVEGESPQLVNSGASRPSASTRAISQAITQTAPEARGIARSDLRHLVALAIIVVRRPTLIAAPRFAESLAQFATGAPPNHDAADTSPSPGTGRSPEPTGKPETTLAATGAADARPDLPPVADNPPPLTETQNTNPCLSGEIEPQSGAFPAVHTNFGGLFFLLNSFLTLGIYGDFTQTGDTLKGLSPFELMHMLGTTWFGTRFENDPLAPLLVELAGLQPGEKPGDLFDPPRWSVSASWLLPWPDAERRQFNFPLTIRAGSRATQKRQWIGNLARYLAARLERALDDPDAVAITCGRPGRVTRQHDHLDIHFALADHPVSLRFAGLDRDPGWVPAAARVIAFSFR